jgi:hypothetical protein
MQWAYKNCWFSIIVFLSTLSHSWRVASWPAPLTGGPGLGVFDSCIMTEEFSYGCAGINAVLGISSIGVSNNFIYNLSQGVWWVYRWHGYGSV